MLSTNEIVVILLSDRQTVKKPATGNKSDCIIYSGAHSCLIKQPSKKSLDIF